ncbi:DUF916 domain-containing protein [Agromyces intestinalis]|uniref:DUF916 domain-containing protein n=1 Tax=Agromyces intestinalis TaxID=2592652 RepID=A0A5C1YLX8_9MICO|nr:DUF916 domain-containing protein [Agromyces intestinalis]
MLRTAGRPSRAAAIAFSALFAALLAAGSLAGATAASADEAAPEGAVTWGVRTASNALGTARDNFAYAVDPGVAVDDALVVTNHDDVPLALDLYAADAFTTTAGQLDVLARDTASNDAGTWISLDRESLELAPGESAEVPFTVAVPDDATPGDYAAGIITSLDRPADAAGITVDRRLGIRVQLRVGGVLDPSLSIEGLHVDYAGTFNPFGTGSATVEFTVRNSGNVRLAAGQAVAIAGPFGMLRTDAIGVPELPELLPGETWPVTVPVDGVFPAFWVTASATLSPRIPAIDETTVPPAVAPVTSESGTWAVPWALLGLVLLVAAAAVAASLLGRRARRLRAEREEARVQAAVEQALRERETTPPLVG